MRGLLLEKVMAKQKDSYASYLFHEGTNYQAHKMFSPAPSVEDGVDGWDILQIEIFAVNLVKKFVACAAVASSVGNYLANINLPFVRKPLDNLPDARNTAYSAFDHIWHVAAQRQQKINI